MLVYSLLIIETAIVLYVYYVLTLYTLPPNVFIHLGYT